MTTKRHFWTANGTNTTDGGDVDVAVPDMTNPYVSASLYQFQVRVRYTDSPDPASGSFTVSVKVLGDTEFQSIGTINMASNNVYKFEGLVSEIRISPPANSPANNYAWYLAGAAR